MPRLRELDSLRGLAASTVLAEHLMLIFPAFDSDTWNGPLTSMKQLIKYTPLHLFWAGDEAVIFFFVLSGFVLSVPFYSGKVLYFRFILRRIFRIYIPYVLAVALAYLAWKGFHTDVAARFSGWFNGIWNVPVTSHILLQHLILIGRLNVNSLDPPIWSLSQELRISLIFPVLMVVVTRSRWQWSMLLALCTAALSFRHGLYTPPGTFDYILYFVMGSLLARYRKELTHRFTNMRLVTRVTLSVVAVLLYTYRWWTYGYTKIHLPVVDFLLVSIGVSIIILLALSSPNWSKFLLFKPIRFAGRISYSLYLLHMVVILTLTHALSGKLPISLIVGLSVVISLLLATVSYYLIEVPSIWVGRRLTTGSKQRKVLANMYNTHDAPDTAIMGNTSAGPRELKTD